MNFWETYRKAPVNVFKWWGYSRLVGINKKLNYFLQLGEFNVPTTTWLGSSYITTEFRSNSNLTGRFSLPYPLIAPDGVDFCLAIRQPIVNSTGLNIIRYKLWENVGERLVYPLYAGEVFNLQTCVFEIWSTSENAQTSLAVPFNLYISQLIAPSNLEQCCSRADGTVRLNQYCSIFSAADVDGNYAIPIEFNQCFNDIFNPSTDTFYRVTENGDIRSNENDDLRVYV